MIEFDLKKNCRKNNGWHDSLHLNKKLPTLRYPFISLFDENN